MNYCVECEHVGMDGLGYPVCKFKKRFNFVYGRWESIPQSCEDLNLNGECPNYEQRHKRPFNWFGFVFFLLGIVVMSVSCSLFWLWICSG